MGLTDEDIGLLSGGDCDILTHVCTSEDTVRKKDKCWSVRIVKNPRELLGISITSPEVVRCYSGSLALVSAIRDRSLEEG